MTPKYWSSNSWPLGRLGAEQGPAGDEQVGPGEDEVAVDEEVFLLRTGIGHDRQLGLDAEELEHALGLLVQGLGGAQERGLLVQGLTGPGKEDGGDAQEGAVGVLQDVGRAGHVPGGVAAGLEGGAQAARGEARGVGLALDEHRAAELGYGAAAAVGHQEGVVLLGGQPGQGVEDVGEVGGSTLNGPVLHGVGHHVGDGRVELCAQLYGLLQRLEHGLGQPVAHDFFVEHVAAEYLGRLGLAEVQRRVLRLVVDDRRDRIETCLDSAHRGPLSILLIFADILEKHAWKPIERPAGRAPKPVASRRFSWAYQRREAAWPNKRGKGCTGENSGWPPSRGALTWLLRNCNIIQYC